MVSLRIKIIFIPVSVNYRFYPTELDFKYLSNFIFYAKCYLDSGASSVVWQRQTIIAVCWFAGRKCKNQNRQFIVINIMLCKFNIINMILGKFSSTHLPCNCPTYTTSVQLSNIHNFRATVQHTHLPCNCPTYTTSVQLSNIHTSTFTYKLGRNS